MSGEDANNLVVSASVPTGIGDDQLLAVAAAAERRIEAVNKIKLLSLRVTNHRDWSDQGGNPYLQVSGSEKVARLFGISWRLDPPAREDHDDGHFSYSFKGYFSMGTAEIEIMGTRSSKDPFFSGSKNNPKPPSEIDRNDVLKGAMTNCIGNGVTRLLGIRNLTWADLEAANIKQENVGKVNFRDSNPLSAPNLPNYGHNHCKGKPMDDPAVTVDDLKFYVQATERSLQDPEKAKYKANNERTLAALKAELARRNQQQPSPSASQEQAPSPAQDSTNSEADGPSEAIFTADNICKQFEVAQSMAELSQIMNQWQGEILCHTQEDQAKVSKAFTDSKKRFGKK